MRKKEIGISILDADILNLRTDLEVMKSLCIKNIHIDIMDTSFTENISFGPSIVNKVLEHDFVFDVHIMLKNPLNILKCLNVKRINRVIVHAEINNLAHVLSMCKEYCSVGVAVNPETSLEVLDNIYPEFVLVMCVKPGFGGQSFQNECVEKVKTLAAKGVCVGVDGGINLRTIDLVREADYFVVGSAFFRSQDKKSLMEELYKQIE